MTTISDISGNLGGAGCWKTYIWVRSRNCGCLVTCFCYQLWVRSRNRGCLVTWFCFQLIAKTGNKTAAVSWPDPYKTLGSIFPTQSITWLLMIYISMVENIFLEVKWWQNWNSSFITCKKLSKNVDISINVGDKSVSPTDDIHPEA